MSIEEKKLKQKFYISSDGAHTHPAAAGSFSRKRYAKIKDAVLACSRAFTHFSWAGRSKDLQSAGQGLELLKGQFACQFTRNDCWPCPRCRWCEKSFMKLSCQSCDAWWRKRRWRWRCRKASVTIMVGVFEVSSWNVEEGSPIVRCVTSISVISRQEVEIWFRFPGAGKALMVDFCDPKFPPLIVERKDLEVHLVSVKKRLGLWLYMFPRGSRRRKWCTQLWRVSRVWGRGCRFNGRKGRSIPHWCRSRWRCRTRWRWCSPRRETRSRFRSRLSRLKSRPRQPGTGRVLLVIHLEKIELKQSCGIQNVVKRPEHPSLIRIKPLDF